RGSAFAVFSTALQSGGTVAGIKVPGGATYTRRELDELTETAKRYGAKGLVWMALGQPDPEHPALNMRSSATKFLTGPEADAIISTMQASPGDLLLIVADRTDTVRAVLGRLRADMGRRLYLLDDS